MDKMYPERNENTHVVMSEMVVTCGNKPIYWGTIQCL